MWAASAAHICFIDNYYCPVNAFKLFKIRYLSNYKPLVFLLMHTMRNI